MQTYDGSTWHIETVDSEGVDPEGRVGYFTSLALSPTNGYPRISYLDDTNLDLKYAAYDGSTWHIETVDSEGVVGIFTSLALDPTNGYPRISYLDDTNLDLKYAAYDGSTWHIEAVDSAGVFGTSTSLTLDPTNGYPRISYGYLQISDAQNSDLKYAAYDGSTWHIETVDSAGDVGYSTSLALNPTNGYPRISYSDYTNDDLKYAAYDGSTWQIETVDSAGDVGYSISLALDPTNGYSRISYYDSTNHALKYASLLPNDPPIIDNPMLPVANFTADPTQGDAPLTVQFNDSSENATAGTGTLEMVRHLRLRIRAIRIILLELIQLV